MIIRNMAAHIALRNGTHLGRFAVVAVFLLSFFVSGAWGACVEVANTKTFSSPGCSTTSGFSNCSNWIAVSTGCGGSCSSVYGHGSGSSYCVGVSAVNTNCDYWGNNTGVMTTVNYLKCDNKCEADSLQCVNDGNEWTTIPAGTCNGKGCVEAPQIDSTACEPYRQECESFGGRFTGNVVTSDVSETGCLSFCDMCTSEGQELYRKSRAMVCCRKGMAPPASVTSCQNLELSGSPDMSFSSFDCDNRGGYDCECEEISSENVSTYNSICNNNEWPESSESGGGPESSSSEGEPSDSSGDWEYDYRDSLHRIIKYDSINMENTSAILSCLLSPVSCNGLNGGDSVVVNVPSDSVILKDIRQNQNSMNTMVDSSIHNSTERLGEKIDTAIHASNNRLGTSIDLSLGRANDSLIDSIGKYVRGMSGRVSDSLHNVAEAVRSLNGTISNFDSATRASMNEIISSLSGSGLSAWDSALGSGPGADTGSVSYSWLQDGDRLADSILQGSGYGGLDFEGDSLLRDSLLNAGYSCNNDSCCIGSQCVYFDSDSLIEDSLTRYISRMGDSINQKNTSYLNDSTTALFSEVQDSLKAFNPLGIFDSTMLNTLGAKIPNTNTCPEHCSRFQVDIPFFFGTRSYTIDFGLCLGRSVFANGNVLSFLRFIIRLIVAITCITAVMWNAARIRR